MYEETLRLIKDNIVDETRDITSIEMGCDNVQMSCTTGKIKVWLGRQTSSDVVRKVINCFSKIDPSITHEKEIICNYEQIPVYENHGYTLISYGKAQDGYKAIFNIQFSKQNALELFVESIVTELNESEVNKVLHWTGSIPRLILIFHELKSIDGWDITKIEYRDEE
ncbi:MAG: hypothetical protein GWP12_00540 [Nitrospirae bacterium]|nr:hypothetical protein [Nitrospirota bacterium]